VPHRTVGAEGVGLFDELVDPQGQMSLLDQGTVIAKLSELVGIQVDVATIADLNEPIRRRVLPDAVALR
jgi:predicted nucleotidyltransferase